MDNYSHIRYALYFIGVAADALVCWLFLQSGLSAKTRTFAEKNSQLLVVQIAIFVFLFSLFCLLLESPLLYFSEFWLEHHYALSDQSLIAWFGDTAKYFAVKLAIEIPLFWLLYRLWRNRKQTWPWLLFAISIPLIFLFAFATPLIIDPIFNKYTLMPQCRLREQMEALEARSGVSGAPIFIVDKSRQTKKLNAYVIGIGGSARVVFWDNTFKLPDDQILAVLAHELGHYVLNHIYWGCAIAIAVSLFLVPVNKYLAEPLFARLPRQWGVQDLRDIAGIPVITLITIAAGFLSDPIANAYSRHIEHEADAFALHLTGDGSALARTFVSLAKTNLTELQPPPFIEFWLFSHPSLKHRIEYVLRR